MTTTAPHSPFCSFLSLLIHRVSTSLCCSLSFTFFLLFFISLFFLSPLHLSSLLWKLDDTTSPWTWLALSQLSYGLLFHEHRCCYYSSLLLILSFSSLSHAVWVVKPTSNSMTAPTEVFNSFLAKVLFSPQSVYSDTLSHTYLPFSRVAV